MSYILVLIILHFLSDWILQPRSVAKRKASSFKWMMKHIVVIHIIFAVYGYTGVVSQWIVLINTASHLAIDKGVWWTYRRLRIPLDDEEYIRCNKYAEDYWYYFCIAVDQTLHLCILIWLFSGGLIAVG